MTRLVTRDVAGRRTTRGRRASTSRPAGTSRRDLAVVCAATCAALPDLSPVIRHGVRHACAVDTCRSPGPDCPATGSATVTVRQLQDFSASALYSTELQLYSGIRSYSDSSSRGAAATSAAVGRPPARAGARRLKLKRRLEPRARALALHVASRSRTTCKLALARPRAREFVQVEVKFVQGSRADRHQRPSTSRGRPS